MVLCQTDDYSLLTVMAAAALSVQDKAAKHARRTGGQM